MTATPDTTTPVTTDPATLLGNLAADHPTADALAAHLARFGARGQRMAPRFCVVAAYLRTFYPDATVCVHPVVAFGDTSGDTSRRAGYVKIDGVEVALPPVVNELAERFDEGRYPELVGDQRPAIVDY